MTTGQSRVHYQTNLCNFLIFEPPEVSPGQKIKVKRAQIPAIKFVTSEFDSAKWETTRWQHIDPMV